MNTKRAVFFVVSLTSIPEITRAWGTEGFMEALFIQAVFIWCVIALAVAAAMWDIYKNKSFVLFAAVSFVLVMLYFF